MSTNDPGQPQPEYVGAETPPSGSGEPPRHGRRTAVIAAVAVAVVAAVGAGAYGVLQLMSGGSSPATAVPADAVGYVSLDLDPSATQKIEAFKILRKFPAIRDELNLGSRDDLRKAVFDQIKKSGECDDLDYAADVEPWIGDRIAVAAVPDTAKGALPLVVLQVSDEAAAKAGMRKIESCSSGPDQPDDELSGYSVVGDYLLVAETQKQADAMAKDADGAALADDADFTTAMERLGDPGIISMYASKDAPQAMVTAMGNQTGGQGGAGGNETDRLQKMFKDFEGSAGVVRFSDGAVEAEFAGKGLPTNLGAVDGAGGPDVSTLPATTAAAFSVALREGWLSDYLEQMRQMMGVEGSLDDMLAEGERQTGLQLPEDIETLLGSGFSLSFDAKADLDALMDSPDPTRVPAGIRIQGDPKQITPIIDKLKRSIGPGADIVKVGTGDGVVAVGLDPDYVDLLLEKGDLGQVAAFSDAVPDAGRASTVLYVNFDAGDGWAERLADVDPEMKANVVPLDAMGMTGWMGKDDVQHGLMRLTTD